MSADRAAASVRPHELVTYFGGYASAIDPTDVVSVHIFMDGDTITFCNHPNSGRLNYGTPKVVGGRYRQTCERCFSLAQEARRDV